jgi:hypothetical protein
MQETYEELAVQKSSEVLSSPTSDWLATPTHVAPTHVAPTHVAPTLQ